MTITLVNGMSALKTLVDTVFATGKAFDTALHEAAYNCLNHAVSTGDVRPMVYLYVRLPAKAQLALREWCIAFGPFKYLSKTNELKFARRDDTDMEAAEYTSPLAYTKAKRETVKVVFTDEKLAEAINRLVTRAGKAHIGNAAKAHMLKAIEALATDDEFTVAFAD